MFTKYLNFVRGISLNRWSKLGVIIVTSSFICMIIFEIGRVMGIITSSYAGLVTYMLFPALFLIGLIFIPIGLIRLKKSSGKTIGEILRGGFNEPDIHADIWGSKFLRTVGLMTVLNILFFLFIGSQMFSFMDSSKFCGTACHSVMNPEWVTYQQSPHARVQCVQCHVGEGADALINSKLNGLWQMVSVTFDLLERPIPTPVHQLRPARQTCEKCHWPDKFYGTRLKTIARYELDEMTTPKYSTLNLKVDVGKGVNRTGIHWHIAKENEVRYASVDDKREEIIWAEVRQADGSINRYTNKTLKGIGNPATHTRVMDCVDCHNRATHIYEDPEGAIDKHIQNGLINRSLPYIKREALSALTIGFPDKNSAVEGISNHLYGFYQRQYPEIAKSKTVIIDSAIAILQKTYSRNIHPEMNITWGTYASYIGHKGNTGCFRCHNSNMADGQGNSISDDCTLCHSILADRQANPFQYLLPADTADVNYELHKYLGEEFFQSF